jgi:uracil-DNA glycosylase
MGLARRLVATLPSGIPGAFNPWRERCAFDTRANGPMRKLERLAAHLNCQPYFIICGEAAGHLGCRHSGIAFTSERLLLDRVIPRMEPVEGRLTKRKLPLSEPSATVVWRTLYDLKIADRVVLWNALPLHPHVAGQVRSNRTPSSAELSLGSPALRLLIDAFPLAKLIPVGKKAEGLLRAMGVSAEPALRHPAYGGATAFSKGMRALVQNTRRLRPPTAAQTSKI